MADFNKLFNNFNKLIKKDKSAEELARERLQREMGNSGSILGIVFCSIALVCALSMILAGENTATKIGAGIVSVVLAAAIIFLALNYFKRKNAMEGILEAFFAGERDISYIAASVDQNSKTVCKMLQAMVSKNIIRDVYIDKLNNKIVDKVRSMDSSQNAGKIVVCAGCGAKNTLTGKPGQTCEYCGAVIGEDKC